MLKEGLIDSLCAKRVNPVEFNFETLTAPSLYSFISEYEIGKIYDIVTSIQYSAQLSKKKEAIKSILAPRGFMAFASGTNRMCFRYLEDKRFIIKVPYKESGLDSGFREYKNQMKLKPFISKTFDVHPSGCVSQHERVLPITNREEYMSVVDDVFAMLTALFGNYVLEDVGTKYFMNIGIRSGFGVVILDYPDLFELDGRKLFCNRPIYPNTKFPVCGGLIDVDAGFNCLVCKTCGKEYTAASLQKAKDNNLIILEGDSNMKVSLLERGIVVAEYDDDVSDTIIKPKSKITKIRRPKQSNVSIFVRGEMEEPVVVEEYVEQQPDDTQKITPESQTVTTVVPDEEFKPVSKERTVYPQEQTDVWIDELTEELGLTEEELIVAEATISETMNSSFSYYNKTQLQIFFTNIRASLNARKLFAGTYEEIIDQDTDSTQEDDVVVETVETEEVITPKETESETVYTDSEDMTTGIIIPDDIKAVIKDDTSAVYSSTDSFTVGNNQQESKQESNKIDVQFHGTFLTGRDSSQY